MTIQERIALAKKVNGLLGTGSLNWLGDYNNELKKGHFSIFFSSKSKAQAALSTILDSGMDARIVPTPSFVNVYFKFAVTITLP